MNRSTLFRLCIIESHPSTIEFVFLAVHLRNAILAEPYLRVIPGIRCQQDQQ